MRRTIDLHQYSPIISDKNVGEEIFNKIWSLDPKNNQVEIDMNGIMSMTTYCAKQIFGRLYKELAPSLFESNIILKNATEDVILIIKMGIRNAVIMV